MVGDLENVDLGESRVGRQQGLLGGGFEVAQEEQGQARRADEEGDARVVRTLGRGRSGWGRGPEDLPGKRAEASSLPRLRRDDRDMRRPGRAAYGLGLAWWFFQGGRLDRADRAAA